MGFKARKPSDAVAMLSASHGRQEERLTEGLNAAKALTDGDGAGTHLAVLEDVLAFLHVQAKRHVLDEEVTIFPRLPDVSELNELVAVLRKEHADHETMLAELNAMAEPWIASGAIPDRESAQRFAASFAAFCVHYVTHIELEDDSLLPAMRRYLSRRDRVALAREMQARRPG